jgi:DNA helicase-2/ATP-dependent DNA helicase PcrA
MPEGAEHDLLADLTPAQCEAVTHLEGPLLILAGAGSGKTRVITRRVAYLLQQGVKPYQILAITFTNKAASEMRQRIETLLPNSRVWISTFHSFGARLLRLYADQLGLERNFTIYDQQDRNRLVKAALEQANIDNIHFAPERIESAISRAKNQLLLPERYAARATDFFSLTVARVYPIYEKKLRDANALDFDDLLLKPALALRDDPELRAELDARFRFVLIDEYQDTNSAQYAIARGLSVDHPNLCVVGDPDQSIYAWRGANIRNILDFEEDFPNARVITLERNYRSTKSILGVASHLIGHNRQRKRKGLTTENPTGQPVTVLTFETGLDEADTVARRIRDSVQMQGRSYRDFAVFLRVNALSRELETAFLKHRVPYQIVKGLAFFERKENRDVLAYLRLLLNPRDDLSFVRAVNEPARGVGKVSLEHLGVHAEPRGISLLEACGQVTQIPAIKGKAAAGLRKFAELMHELAQLADAPPDVVIRQVLDRSGYRHMLQASNDPEDQERLANIEELITAAKQFTAEDSDRTLGDWLENITLASDVDSWDERQDRVSIMTLHSAKGLEFPVVYMTAVEQELLPHERSMAKVEDIEEERRLAFVGITRAKEELYLCHARLREFRGQTRYPVESMFLNELGDEGIETMDLSKGAVGRTRAIDTWRSGSKAAEQGWAEAGISPRPDQPPSRARDRAAPVVAPGFAEGMVVHHEQYGTGRVTLVIGQGTQSKIKVLFRRAGERTFLADKAKLAVIKRD